MKNKMTQRCRLMRVQAARHNKFDKFGHFAQAKLRFGFSLKVISTQWRSISITFLSLPIKSNSHSNVKLLHGSVIRRRISLSRCYLVLFVRAFRWKWRVND